MTNRNELALRAELCSPARSMPDEPETVGRSATQETGWESALPPPDRQTDRGTGHQIADQMRPR